MESPSKSKQSHQKWWVLTSRISRVACWRCRIALCRFFCKCNDFERGKTSVLFFLDFSSLYLDCFVSGTYVLGDFAPWSLLLKSIELLGPWISPDLLKCGLHIDHAEEHHSVVGRTAWSKAHKLGKEAAIPAENSYSLRIFDVRHANHPNCWRQYGGSEFGIGRVKTLRVRNVMIFVPQRLSEVWRFELNYLLIFVVNLV